MEYAKMIGQNTIWEVHIDEHDNSIDLCIDDLQGDISLCDVYESQIVRVTKAAYDDRINDLKDIKWL